MTQGCGLTSERLLQAGRQRPGLGVIRGQAPAAGLPARGGGRLEVHQRQLGRADLGGQGVLVSWVRCWGNGGMGP